MITNEMKAKIAAMHLGCKVQTPDGIGSFWSVGTDGWIYAKCEGMQSEEYRCDEYQLILTPLNEITDEDIDGCWIAGGGNDGYYDKRGSVETLDFSGFTTTEILQMTDFLRSRGYALPYMGIDLFESGIAIPNNKMK